MYLINVGEILDNLVVDFVQNKKVLLVAKIFLDDNRVSEKKKITNKNTKFKIFFTCESVKNANKFCNDFNISLFVDNVSKFNTHCRNLY